MEFVEEIKQIIDKVNQRTNKDYNNMDVEEIGNELRSVMQFEQKIVQRIEEIEQKGQNLDLTKYAKMICRNTTEREIKEIQEIYFLKLDKYIEYLRNKK